MRFIKKILLTTFVVFSFVYPMKAMFSEPVMLSEGNFVIVGGQKITLKVADTKEKKLKGLMFEKKLGENEGMVFLFKNQDYRTFWMKNMQIPIDMVFINNGKVDTIYDSAPACKQTPCKLYPSQDKVNAVLELQAGFCKKYNVKKGSVVFFSEQVIQKHNLVKPD